MKPRKHDNNTFNKTDHDIKDFSIIGIEQSNDVQRKTFSKWTTLFMYVIVFVFVCSNK